MTITATLLVPAATPAAAATPGNATSAERSTQSGMPDFAAFLLGNVPGLEARPGVGAAKPEGEDPEAKPADPREPEEASADTPRESTQLLAALPLFREMLPSASHPQPRTKDGEAEAAEGVEASPLREPSVQRPEVTPAFPAAALEASHRPVSEPALPALGAPLQFHPGIESRTAAAPAHPVVALAAPVGHAAWSEEFASKVTWLATSRIQAAELRVQPPELGPVHVHIRIEANEAKVSLVAPHADTRHALEAALPDLRELLEARGIALGDTSIGSHGPGSDPGRTSTRPAVHHGAGGTAEDESLAAPNRPARTLQLVDVFA